MYGGMIVEDNMLVNKGGEGKWGFIDEKGIS